MQQPKRHHFSPCLHLRNFVGANGHIWTYDAHTAEVRSSRPENTAVESHFYSAEMPDGTMDTRVEQFLATIESDAAPTYKALLNGEVPTDEKQRANFAVFLALMYVRTPAMRAMYAEGLSRHMQIMNYAYADHDKSFDALTERFEAEDGQVLSPEYKELLRKTFRDPSDYVIQIPKERTLNVLGVANTLAPILFRMKWATFTPQHGFFITTDNPLIRDVDPKTRHPIYGDHGFLNKTAEVIFPLSSQRLLFLSWNEPASHVGIVPRAYVERINRALAANSDRYLYAHICDKRLQRLAAEFKDSRPKMTTQGYGPERFAETEIVRRSRKE